MEANVLHILKTYFDCACGLCLSTIFQQHSIIFHFIGTLIPFMLLPVLVYVTPFDFKYNRTTLIRLPAGQTKVVVLTRWSYYRCRVIFHSRCIVGDVFFKRIKVSSSNLQTIQKHLHSIQINIYFNWNRTVLTRAILKSNKRERTTASINKTKMMCMEGTSVSFMKLTIFGKNLKQGSPFASE